LHGSKLLKKPDQCRAVYLASHLWWVVENSQKEEDAANVSLSYRLYNRNFFLTKSTAVSRRKACSRMPPASPSRGRCLHGHGGVSGALCRNPQSIRLLL
jgi:vacuolar protein sorting-associated protein 35